MIALLAGELIALGRTYAPEQVATNRLHDASYQANIDRRPAGASSLLAQDGSSNTRLAAQENVVFLEELSMNRRECFDRFYGKWRAFLAFMFC